MKSYFRNLSLSRQFLLIAIGVTLVMLLSISIYMVNASIDSENKQLQVMANGRAGAVIEKIDRNFYERFGDVQAFAFNRLAVQAAKDSVTTSAQEFINTMVSYYVLYDLMLIADANGRVKAANTIDKNGHAVQAGSLIGKNVSNEGWFKACMSAKGPEGGAWYSDFMENTDVSSMTNNTGWGMAFAAPIKNENGVTVGVWYNFANWSDVTVDIRKETERALRETQPSAFILVLNNNNQVIDSEDERMLLSTRMTIDELASGHEFDFLDRHVSTSSFIFGSKEGKGAYTYKGKNWRAIAFIPKVKFSLGYLFNNMAMVIASMVLLLIGTGVIFYRTANRLSGSIGKMQLAIEKLSQGELVQIESSQSKSEIGKIEESLKSLVERTRESSSFAQLIGEGNLSRQYNALSEKDVLGLALVNMRANLQRIKEEDNKRAWSTEGLAEIGNILRAQNTDASALYNSIIKFVVKYTNSNQGSLFLMNEDNSKRKFLELSACYAWDKKKFLQKQIAIGEGLAGQCAIEQQTIYMTKVPANYISITSGLGTALPNSLLIVPLKINDEIHGVLEIAGFSEYELYVREFIEKLSETIAATISNVRVNERTKELLAQTQQQAEEMRAQEEEMRQNMEEMQATQEEMQRKSLEVSTAHAEMSGIMEAINSTMATIEFTPDGYVVKANENFHRTMKSNQNKIEGQHHRFFVPEDILNSVEYLSFWSSLASGQAKKGLFKRIALNGDVVWLDAIYTPIKNAKGVVTKVVKFATDVTAMQKMLAKAEALESINS